MSAEIPGYDKNNDLTTQRAASAAVAILRATGVEAGLAVTTGDRAAEYSAKVLLTAMQNVHGTDVVRQITGPEVWREMHQLEIAFDRLIQRPEEAVDG